MFWVGGLLYHRIAGVYHGKWACCLSLFKYTSQTCHWLHWQLCGVGEGEGTLTVRPHTASASACRLLLQFKAAAQHQANVFPSLLLDMAACRVYGQALSGYLGYHVTYERRDYKHVCSPPSHRIRCWTVRGSHTLWRCLFTFVPSSISWLAQCCCPAPRDHQSSTHPARKPSSDITDYIRKHIRTYFFFRSCFYAAYR